jgi:hypothetical protein
MSVTLNYGEARSVLDAIRLELCDACLLDQRFTSDLSRGFREDWPSSAGFVRWNVKSKQVFVGAPPGE